MVRDGEGMKPKYNRFRVTIGFHILIFLITCEINFFFLGFLCLVTTFTRLRLRIPTRTFIFIGDELAV